MRNAERGFLLLTSHLGDPESKPLTVAQFRVLLSRVQSMKRLDGDRELTAEDLREIGYSQEAAEQILRLLSRQEELDYYVNQAARSDCYPITRGSPLYPAALRERLGTDCPGCLWAKGDCGLLSRPMIALVGSRDLCEANRAFAEEAGRQAALQGYVLLSGNARGADRTAQDSCLASGGQVVSIVADRLSKCKDRPGVLYLSEDSFDFPFSAIRALSRNRLIHAMGEAVLIAQCTHGKGGTWSGTVQNLRHDWTPVFCFSDGSKATAALAEMGASLISADDLTDISSLKPSTISFLE